MMYIDKILGGKIKWITKTNSIIAQTTILERQIHLKKIGVGKTVFVPFLAGIVGAGLVIGVCFGVPQFRENILKTTSPTVPTYSTIDKSKNSDETTAIRITDIAENGPVVAEKVLPSIVGIEVTYNVNSLWGSTTGKAAGSGIIISDDGYIITNNHVISAESSSAFFEITKATGLKVKLYNDDKEYDAKVVGTDTYTDIAVIKIEATGLSSAILGNSDELKVGETAFAIGNPVGMDFTVTHGIISATNREVKMTDGSTYITIQTDAAINSGNSGGALVNTRGEVVGINTLKISGNGIEGMSFAIPISSVKDTINQLIENKSVVHPYIGVSGETISKQVAELYGLPQGISITKVYEKSPAEKAGIKAGDIIIKIEGKNVTSIPELNRIKNTYKVGDTVTLTLLKSGKENDVKVTLGEEPEEDELVTDTENQIFKDDSSKENSGFDGIWDLFR